MNIIPALAVGVFVVANVSPSSLQARPRSATRTAQRPAAPSKAAPGKAAPSKPATRVEVWREGGSPINGLAVSPQRVLVTEGGDTMYLYGTDGKLQKQFKPTGNGDTRVFTYDAAISPDGKYAVAAGVELMARLIDLDSGTVASRVSGDISRLNGVAYAPDGKHVAIATSIGVIVSIAPGGGMLDPSASERNVRPGFKGLTAGAGSVAFSPDSRLLAVGGEDKSVRLYNVADGSEVAIWREHEGAVRALAWTRDNKRLATGSRDGVVKVWDVAAGKSTVTITPGAGAIESLAWASAGTVLAVAVAAPGQERAAKPSEPEWNPPAPTDTPNPVVQIYIVGDALASLKRAVQRNVSARKIAFNPDGRLIAGYADGRVEAYDLAAIPVASPQAATEAARTPVVPDDEGFRTLSGLAGGAQSVKFSRDGKWLAGGNAEGQVVVWDVVAGKVARRITGHTKGINSLAWSPDGALLASAGEDRLQVAGLADGKVLWSVEGRAVLAGFAPEGRSVFAFGGVSPGTGSPVMRGWGASDGSPGPALGSLRYPGRAALSPDGSLLAADQATSKNYHDTTVLYVFPTTPDPAITGLDDALTFTSIHGRVDALSWPSPARLIVDEGDHRDGHTDTDKLIPGKMGVRIFNPVTKREEKPFLNSNGAIVALDESSRGELAIVENRIAVRVLSRGWRELAAWSIPDRSMRVKSLAWSPPGDILALGIEGLPVRLWHVPRR